MAKKTPSKKSPPPALVPSLRSAVVRLQRDGGRVMKGLERDVRAFVRRARSDLTTEAGALRREVTIRLRKAVRDIDGRAASIVRQLEQRLEAVESGLRVRLGAASADDATSLKEQLASMNERLRMLERKHAELTEELHDQIAPENG